MAQEGRSARAAYWSVIEALGRSGIQFVISVILARLLSPEEFGTVAMLLIFTTIAAVFAEGGFGAALVQRQEISDQDTSSVFAFNVLAGLITASTLCLAAAPIARFFGVPILESLMWLLSLDVVFSALGATHAALLMRDLDFRTQARVTVMAVIGSGSVGIAMAWAGHGVWSLAVQIVLGSAISTMLLWIYRPWRPGRGANLASLKSLFSFGSYLLLTGLINTLYSKLTSILIAKYHSAAELGHYSRADRTQQLPTDILSSAMNRVVFPIFSAAKQDRAALREGVRSAVILLMMVNLPMMLGMAAVAEPLVLVLFGEAWAPTAPLLRILCLAGIFWPLHVVNLSVLKAVGRSDIYFWLDVLKKILGVSAILYASTIGVEAMAWSQAILGVVSYLINAIFTGRFADYSALRQIRDILPYAGAGLAMVATIRALGEVWQPGPMIGLTAAIFAGAIIYGLICVTFKPAAYRILAQHTRAITKRQP